MKQPIEQHHAISLGKNLFFPLIPRPTDYSLGKTNTIIPSVKKQIEEYTTRQLSRSVDYLDAFSGVLNFYASTIFGENMTHLWGIPVQSHLVRLKPSPGSWEDHMRPFQWEGYISLQWYSTEPSVRQSDFPSWSWAGWKGAIQYFDDDMDCSYTPIQGQCKTFAYIEVEPNPNQREPLC